VRARIAGLGQLDHRDIERWRDLATRAAEPNPFLEPYFLVPAAHHRQDAESTQLLLVEDDTELLAVMAFSPVKRSIRGVPINAITTGTPLLVTESERWHPLVDATRAVEALECLLDGARRLSLPSFMDLERIPADGSLAQAWYLAAASAGVPIIERGGQDYAYVYRRDEPKPTEVIREASALRLRLDHLSHRTRKRFSHSLRDLEQRIGGELTMVDRGPDPDALDEFLRLQASGWKGDVSRGGGAFLVTGQDRWFREVTSSFREDGRLCVFLLKAGADTIYASVRFRSGNGLFAVHDAFDETYAEFGAGGLGRLSVISRSMVDYPVDFYDSSMNPKYVDSTHLYPDRRRFVSLLLAPRGVLPRAALRAVPVLRNARDRVATARTGTAKSA
jgi:Acetyltransferase (GNAT) domain